MVPIFPGHVFRVCALVGALSFLQVVMTQRPYSGYRNRLYPRLRPNYAPSYWGDFNSLNNFEPFYMDRPYFPQRSFVQPFSDGFSGGFGSRFRPRIFNRPRPVVIRNALPVRTTNDIRTRPSMLTPVPLIGQRQHVMQKARHHQEKKIRHHQEKKRVRAINAGIFPAVYPHPKIQRHMEHKAKKRAKFRGIPKAKSFNGILKGTALDVSF